MARRTPAQLSRLGALSLITLALVMVAAFNLQKFPGFAGTGYHAEFTDAGGLHKGCIVEIAGIKVGRVNNLRIDGNKVIVDFDVHNAQFGTQSHAGVQVLNLLGEKFLNIEPMGSDTMQGGGTIPVAHTDVAYDIVGTLGHLTTDTEQINTKQLSQALSTLGDTLHAASPEIQSSFTGISRLSGVIASRNDEIGKLLQRADHVTKLLSNRRGDIVVLMKQANLLFAEVQARRQALQSLLVNTRRLAVALHGVATDNQRQIGPAMAQLHTVEDFLISHLGDLKQVLHNLGPYVSILGNIIGTGPWFDDYVVNLAGVGAEFQPGFK